MKSRIRAVSALVLTVIAAQAAAPLSALAGGHEDENLQMSVEDTPPPPAAGTFERMVYDYVHAYNADDRIHKAIYSSRIRRSIFFNPGSQEYIDHLQYIDSQASSAPEAIYDLAKSLQLHWEAQYALGLGQKRANRTRTGVEIGAIVGMAIAGLAMCIHPEKAPRYFQFMRKMWPLLPLAAPAGVAAGYGTAHALNGFLDGNVPISPAHVMHLGISTEDLAEDDNSMVTDLTAITAGLAVGEAFSLAMKAIRAAEVVNEAATPAKINPYVLVGSIILTLVVDYGVREGIDYYEMTHLTGRFEGARDLIDWSIAANDDSQLYRGADALVATGTNLANYINHPILEAIQDFSTDVAKASHDLGEGTPAYLSRLNELTADLSQKVRDATAEQDATSDDDYKSILVLGYLSNHDESSIDSLGETAATLARTFQTGFEPWLNQAENQQQQTLGNAGRDEVFRRYVRGILDAKYRAIAREFRGGQVPRNANHVLLEAAALLRSTDKEYVEDQADFLMSLIARNDMLLNESAASLAGAANSPNGGAP